LVPKKKNKASLGVTVYYCKDNMYYIIVSVLQNYHQ